MPDFDSIAQEVGIPVMSFSASGSIYFEGNPLLVNGEALPLTVAASRMRYAWKETVWLRLI
jgi:hypothetical protein